MNTKVRYKIFAQAKSKEVEDHLTGGVRTISINGDGSHSFKVHHNAWWWYKKNTTQFSFSAHLRDEVDKIVKAYDGAPTIYAHDRCIITVSVPGFCNEGEAKTEVVAFMTYLIEKTAGLSMDRPDIETPKPVEDDRDRDDFEDDWRD